MNQWKWLSLCFLILICLTLIQALTPYHYTLFIIYYSIPMACTRLVLMLPPALAIARLLVPWITHWGGFTNIFVRIFSSLITLILLVAFFLFVFFFVVVPVNLYVPVDLFTLILISLICIAVTLLMRLRKWKWAKVVLWTAEFMLAAFCFFNVFPIYDTTFSDITFDNRRYLVVRLLDFENYDYTFYNCSPSGFFCKSYPFEILDPNEPFSYWKDPKTHQVYIRQRNWKTLVRN